MVKLKQPCGGDDDDDDLGDDDVGAIISSLQNVENVVKSRRPCGGDGNMARVSAAR